MAGFALVTVCLGGFFMGIRQTDNAISGTRAIWNQRSAPAPDLESYPEAPLYKDLKGGTLQPNKQWTPHLSSLVQPAPEARFVPAVLSEKDLKGLRERRVSHRQYDGAPPVAPHPLDQRNPAACIECHGKPTVVGALEVPQMSHPYYTSCIQCHVSAVGPASWWKTRNEGLSDGNSFQGRGLSGQGARAYVGAPPVIPHTTWMRENCMSCHGPGGTVALRTSHPNRQSCTQCHAPNAVLDQRLAAGLPPPLPLSEWANDASKQ